MSDYSHLVGHQFPGGRYTLTPHVAWLWADCAMSEPDPAAAHPSLAYLAAMQGCEVLLADHLTGVLNAGGTPDLEAARTAVAPPMLIAAPTVMVPAPNLAVYDELLRMPILGDAA